MKNQTTNLMQTHPLLMPNGVFLNTVARGSLSEILHRWSWNGVTGGVIYGEARLGKTQAIRSMEQDLKTRGGAALPCVYFSVALRDVPTIASIYRLLCNALKIAHTNRDIADHLADLVVYHLSDRVDQARGNSMVLFVDEMQRLKINQVNVFAELYDRLRLLNVHLMTVFIGNHPECLELVELTKLTRYAHIRGRFFTQMYQFRGLKSAIDVKKCLAQYDSLRFPTDGPSYTEYFLPEAVNNGFTLASLSNDLWQYFTEYARPLKIQSWGMQYFVAAVNCLLLDFLPQHGVGEFGQDMADAAFEISGLAQSTIEVL